MFIFDKSSCFYINTMKRFLSFLLPVLFVFSFCFGKKTSPVADYNIIPLPAEISASPEKGVFDLNSQTIITYPSIHKVLLNEALHLQNYIRQTTGMELKIKPDYKSKNAIDLSLDNVMENPEGYIMNITPEKIFIKAPSAAGVFYGIQTLRKSIPVNLDYPQSVISFPVVDITDYPRFSYRGAHFDVARHFFPQDSVKKFIDLLALHNINNMHWHLTDDQGWRVEIKKYPKLSEISSKRPGTVIGRNTGEYDNVPVEGFFTQDEIRDIVKYASARHINIVPEIDLPGHMVAALTAYPELGCTGGPYEVWKRWGVSEDLLCAGNDSVYVIINDILDEVSDLFPSEYIHIGGDECPKVRWKECVKCQAKIEELGLKGDDNSEPEEKLQAYVMTRAADFLAGKGKKIIGWDEILEGGVSPEATIMSWRSESGGLKAARLGHDVIMTPNNYLYFDYYQTLDKDNEPIAMNGYVPLEKVYSYEPVPSSFSPDQTAHIKGVQANLWTEYIKTFPHAIYMELPRMAALSEVQWTQGNKDYDDFMMRLPAMLEIYKENDYPYSKRAYDVSGNVEVDQENNKLVFNLDAPKGAEIYYTLDGTEPKATSLKYTTGVAVDKDTKLRAKAFYDFGESYVYHDSVSFNKATARPVKLLTLPAPKYAREPWILTNGQKGGDHWNSDKWIGFHGNPVEVVVDMQKPTEFSEVATNTIVDTGSQVFDTRRMTVSVSDDGDNWTQVVSQEFPPLEKDTRIILPRSLSFAPVTSRYIKLELEPENIIPEWSRASGKKAFLFIDEIAVN